MTLSSQSRGRKLTIEDCVKWMSLSFVMTFVVGDAFAQRNADIYGYVYDSETKKPLAAVVTVDGGGAGAACGDDGYFSIRYARRGSVSLRVSMISYEAQIVQVALPLDCELRIFLKQKPVAISEVSITSSTVITDYSSSKRSISKMEIYRLPGVGADIVYASLLLPGMNSYPDAAMILARGGAQDETGIYFDGIKIKHPFRFDSPIYGGNFSILSNEIIKTSYVSQGGIPVKYDNVLSGVLDLNSESTVSRNQLQLGIGLASAGMFTSLKTENGGSSCLLSANLMDTKFFFDVNPASREMSQVPSGKEVYFKFMQNVGSVKTFASALYANDRYSDRGYSESSANGIYSAGVQLASAAGITSVRMGLTKYQQTSSFYSPSETSAQLHIEETYQPDEDVILETGGELYRNESYYEMPDTAASLEYTSTGIFADVKFTPWSRIYCGAGGRLGTRFHSNAITFEPRFFFAFDAERNLTLKFNAGIYRSYYDDNVLIYIGPSTPRSAYYTEISMEKKIGESVDLTVSSFYKYYRDLVTPHGINGFGYSRGAELFVKSIGEYQDVWISYALDDSKRKEMDYISGVFDDRLTPSPYAPLHSAKLAYIAKLGTFNAGIRISYFTGFRYTVFRYDSVGGMTRGEQNGGRYPAYNSVDINCSNVFSLAGFFAVTYLSVTNIFDVQNVRAYLYDRNNVASTYYGFGRSIYFGVAFQWQ